MDTLLAKYTKHKMYSSISKVIFSMLGTVFLTGVVIATRNVIKINRSNATRKKKIKEYQIEKMSAIQLQQLMLHGSEQSA